MCECSYPPCLYIYTEDEYIEIFFPSSLMRAEFTLVKTISIILFISKSFVCPFCLLFQEGTNFYYCSLLAGEGPENVVICFETGVAPHFSMLSENNVLSLIPSDIIPTIVGFHSKAGPINYF